METLLQQVHSTFDQVDIGFLSKQADINLIEELYKLRNEIVIRRGAITELTYKKDFLDKYQTAGINDMINVYLHEEESIDLYVAELLERSKDTGLFA